jgi:hypothetical protein
MSYRVLLQEQHTAVLTMETNGVMAAPADVMDGVANGAANKLRQQ